ncbi:thymidine phosphorylase [Neorhizobium sp. AL 9.2.2]|uniref:thymidine phosphorylase n=1 Tax=Neorhizobium sp. AL 9.2.2 TaxID=2712894 RepID=UPI0015741539|nr:thymidine phosphorylase [Neorhizobium sp. AL 9.2.2]NSY15868.1 thymidine phosphorylase [Neorhizobium sp. AL 9.2.2]
MIPQEIIRRKRDGEVLSSNDIAAFIAAMTDETISEGQVAAFAMAVFFQGMSRDETIALTLAMRDSGRVMQWRDAARPVADKHSTGGVGDNVSLMLAPLAAACGLAVPMISGRGLGHTGGTLDKLEAIPGYDVMPDETRLRAIVRDIGCAIVGQTQELAPADRRLYAIRDVTATVEAISLITASILSKKLAAGLETLVLDVKVGSGAFMRSKDEAELLARSLVEVANGAGLKTVALLTDMNQPLADAAGNALEIRNCLSVLKGEKAGTRLESVVIAEAAEMLVLSNLVATIKEAEEVARRALASGAALERFARMTHALGGPADFCDRPADVYLAEAPVIRPVLAPADGFLASCETRALGMAVVELGGGRRRAGDAIDHRVGIDAILPLGTKVSKGQPIAMVHAASEDDAARAAADVTACYSVSDEAPVLPPFILGRVE